MFDITIKGKGEGTVTDVMSISNHRVDELVGIVFDGLISEDKTTSILSTLGKECKNPNEFAYICMVLGRTMEYNKHTNKSYEEMAKMWGKTELLRGSKPTVENLDKIDEIVKQSLKLKGK